MLFNLVYIEDYVKQLDALLSVDNRKLLDDSERVSYEQAIEKAKKRVQKVSDRHIIIS